MKEMITTFRKKPVVINAIRFTKANAPRDDIWGPFFGITEEKLRQDGYKAPAVQFVIDGNPCFLIRTLEGELKADIGDWIIKGVNGEFYPCKPDVFAKTYEVEPEPPEASGDVDTYRIYISVVHGMKVIESDNRLESDQVEQENVPVGVVLAGWIDAYAEAMSQAVAKEWEKFQ